MASQLVTIPVRACFVSPMNCRKERTEDDIQQLADDIRENGLMNPVSVRSAPGGKYEVYAGQRRLLAHRHLGAKTILAIIENVSDETVQIRTLSENMNRADMTWADKVRSFKGLMHLLGTFAAVRDRTGYSEATIRRYVAISAMDENALEAAEHAKNESKNVDMLNLEYVARHMPREHHVATMGVLARSGLNTQENRECLKASGGSVAQLEMAIVERKAKMVQLTIARPFIRDPRNNRVYELPEMTPRMFDKVKAAIERTIAAALAHPSLDCEICMNPETDPGPECSQCSQAVCEDCYPRCGGTCPFCRGAI